MSDHRKNLEVPVECLRRVCSPVEGGEIKDCQFGQKEALRSIEFGLEIGDNDYVRQHYNIVVIGPQHTGRTARTLNFLQKRAERESAQPPDIIAVPDSESAQRFVVAYVSNGIGVRIKKMLTEFAEQVIFQVAEKIAEYQQKQLARAERFRDQMLTEVSKRTLDFGCGLTMDESGEIFSFTLSRENPLEPLMREEFEQLSDEAREEIRVNKEKADELLNEVLEKIQTLAVEAVKGSIELAQTHCTELLQPVYELIGDDVPLRKYLDSLASLATYVAAKPQDDDQPMTLACTELNPDEDGRAILLRRCQVRVLLDNSQTVTRPVIYADIPQFSRLFGRVNAEPIGREGWARVDHTLVEGGAILEANGGYLLLNLNDLLRWGGGLAFYKLLEVIRTGELVIETKASFADADTPINFRSNEIPIDVRIIAICDRELEMILREVEPEFDNLFRVTAEFESQMDIAQAMYIYRDFVHICCLAHDLPPFTPAAIAKLIEYGSRQVDDQRKATTELGMIQDVIIEAAYWAKKESAKNIGPEHVRQAIKARFQRRTLEVRLHNTFIDDGMLLLEHDGTRVGQINGLCVLALSDDVRWGMPMRITAQAFAGEEHVVLVQREAELSGKASNSAVDTIVGYLRGRYGRRKPFGLTVQLSFEQTYNGIDGDSASLAEVIATISSITELPIRQDLAITGSMNQLGEVQPIGGVNEKIEGHFGALQRRNLLCGHHGVVIPIQNVIHLMLDEDIVAARKRGFYHVYAVTNVEQALELFLDRPIAEIDRLVREKLDEMNAEDDRPKKKAERRRGKK
jgi:lon-related putative ATP-dependent protease